MLSVRAPACRSIAPCGSLVLLLVLGGICHSSRVRGDELQLKNGLTLRGAVLPVSGLNARTIAQNNATDVPVAAYRMVDDGVRRYFIARRQTADVLPAGGDPLSGVVKFKLSHERSGSKGVPAIIGTFAERTEFDRFGRRRVSLRTSGALEHIQQAITEIGPEAVRVESTSHTWVMGLDLSTLPDDLLQEMLHQAIDVQNPDDRRALVRFFIQAQRYRAAREEVVSMAEDFPELAAWAEEQQRDLSHLLALDALFEIRSRQQAGQYELARFVASRFPEDRVSADVLHEARSLVTTYDAARNRAATAAMLLDSLQAQLPGEQARALAPLRAAVISELHIETIPRLDPFLRFEHDETLSPAEKLALAYSGWVLGESDAIDNLDDAIRLWSARFLVLEYLRTNDNPARRADLLKQLGQTEGVSVRRVAQMVKRLPLPLTTAPMATGTPTPLDVLDQWDQPQQHYTVILPPEYSPQHKYPLLVALRAEGRAPEQELLWWAGDAERPGPAQRRGYIVIAPQFATAEQENYDYSAEAHAAVMESLGDARKRFSVDSDRIFLVGHGMGADACFDIAMSRPDAFAGVVPINGVCDRYCTFYRENAPRLAWYVVAGEREGDAKGLALDQNASDLNYMMTHGHDVIYCEYKARGFEPYFEETSRIFDWMSLQRRSPPPHEWEARLLRASDARYYWLELAGLPARLSEPMTWHPPSRRPFPVSARITPGNTIYLQSPAKQVTIWLSPEIVDFDERVKVSGKGHNDFVSPSLGDLLEDLRVRGDRERLYWAKLQL